MYLNINVWIVNNSLSIENSFCCTQCTNWKQFISSFFFKGIIIQVLWCNTASPSSVLVSNSACSIVKKCFKKLSIFVTLEIFFFSKLASIFAKTTDALSPVLLMKCWIFATISLTLEKDFACAMEWWFHHWFLCFHSSSSIPPGKHLALLYASKWCVPNHSFQTKVAVFCDL